MRLISVCAILLGMFVAGYLGLFEVPIEFAFVSWTSFAVWGRDVHKTQRWSFEWFRTMKGRLIARALRGQTLTAAASVVLLGIAIGWLASLA